jgi:hypothetical protein
MPSFRGRRALVLTLVAFLWSVALLVAALVVPIYGPATLVDENGTGVLRFVVLPALLSATAGVALWRKCARGTRGGEYVAWACVLVMVALSLVGILTIGIFIAPVAVLLARAVSQTPSGPPADKRA